MRAIVLSLTLFTLGVVPGSLEAAHRPYHVERFREHVDARFGTTAMVPAHWRPLAESKEWTGQRYVAPDRSAWVAVYSAPGDAEDIEAHIKAVSEVEGEDVTYKRRGRRWIVVSGFKGDRIFYRKALLGCGGTVWHHVAFEYPAGQKREYDAIVTYVARSVEPDPVACNPTVGRSD